MAKTDEMLPMGNLTACFKMVETTRSKAGRKEIHSIITLTAGKSTTLCHEMILNPAAACLHRGDELGDEHLIHAQRGSDETNVSRFLWR